MAIENRIALIIFFLVFWGCNKNVTIKSGSTDSVPDTKDDNPAPPAAINPPTSILLVNPMSSPGASGTPTIRVGGVNPGYTVKIFTNSTCSSEVASNQATDVTIDLTTSALSIGKYTFYAKSISSQNISSACSTTSVNYEVCPSEIGCGAVISTNQTITTLVDFSGSDTRFYATASDSSENVFLGGVVNTGGSLNAYLLKFDTDNEMLDPNFGNNGVTILNRNFSQYFAGLYLNGTSIYGIGQDNFASSGGQSDILMARYNSETGVIDTSFNTTGFKTQAYPGAWYDSGYSVSVLSDIKIYSCGYAYRNGTTWYDAVISRFSSAGVLDTSFGASGHLFINFGGSSTESCYKIIELTEGKFLVYGVYDQAGKGFQPFFQRYNSNWTLDTTFGSSGTLKIDLAIHSFIASGYNLVLEGDILYLVGTVETVNPGPSNGAIMKLNIATASLDTNFGNNGLLTLTPQCKTGDSSGLHGVLLLDDTLLVRGECNGTNREIGFIVPVKKTGELDPYFNNGNSFYYLADTSIDEIAKPFYLKLSQSGAKVFTFNFGVIEVHDLSW